MLIAFPTFVTKFASLVWATVTCLVPNSHTVLDEKNKALDSLTVNGLAWAPRKQSLRQRLVCMGLIWGGGLRELGWETKRQGLPAQGTLSSWPPLWASVLGHIPVGEEESLYPPTPLILPHQGGPWGWEKAVTPTSCYSVILCDTRNSATAIVQLAWNLKHAECSEGRQAQSVRTWRLGAPPSGQALWLDFWIVWIYTVSFKNMLKKNHDCVWQSLSISQSTELSH